MPPPPKDGAKIPPPAGMPPVKTYPISTHPPPAGMTFPGIESAPKEEAKGAGGDPQDGQDGAAPAEEEVDDGFTPEQRRKNALETDGEFKKYLMMYRMKIPLVNIRNKIEADGVYTKADIDVSQCALFDIINRFVWIFYSYSRMKLKYKKLISVS